MVPVEEYDGGLFRLEGIWRGYIAYLLHLNGMVCLVVHNPHVWRSVQSLCLVFSRDGSGDLHPSRLV